MLTILQSGGLLAAVLGLGAIFALALFFERMTFYRRNTIRVAEFLQGVTNLIRRKRYDEALLRCQESYGPVSMVAQAAVQHRQLPRTELRELVREVAQLQVPRLEQHLTALATIGHLSPLVGLLGTVNGMIQAFLQLQANPGTATAAHLSGGIWEALVTTATGLAVGIPTLLAYNYLTTRMLGLVHDMERAGIEILHAMVETDSIIPLDVAQEGHRQISALDIKNR